MKVDAELFFLAGDAFAEALAPFLLRYSSELKVLERSTQADPDLLLQIPASSTLVAAFAPLPLPICVDYAVAADRRKIKMLPILIGEGRIVVGPYRRSSTVACWVCAVRRLQQHYPPEPDRNAALAQYWKQPANIDLLASAALSFLHRQMASSQSEAMVWILDARTRKLTSGIVVPVDGCTVCTQVLPTSAEQLQQEMSSLLGERIDGLC